MQNNQKYKSAITTKYTIDKQLLPSGHHYVSITVLSSFIHYFADHQKISPSSYTDSLSIGKIMFFPWTFNLVGLLLKATQQTAWHPLLWGSTNPVSQFQL